MFWLYNYANIKFETLDRRIMRICKILLAVGGLLTLFFAGCSEPKNFKAVDQICLADVNSPQAVKAAEDVLTSMQFAIEKADVNAGIVKTWPLTAGQPFEFWRKDNVGGFNKAEAALQSIRRIAQVNITRKDQQTCIDCNVTTQRLSLTEQPITSSAKGYTLFTKSGKSMQTLSMDKKRDKDWIDLGADEKLSTVILQKIEKKFANNQGKQMR